MKRSISLTLFATFLAFVQACTTVEDPGPLMDGSKDYALYDFDQLEIGDAFNIEVERSDVFSIHLEGDQRNLNDVKVFKSGTTLVVKFDENSGRKHQTYITVKMPELRAVNFSGGSISTIKGFNSEEELDLYLSGGSLSQLSAGYRALNLTLSGGSSLRIQGLGDKIRADVSGASQLSAFDYPVSEGSVNLSGASNARIKVADQLNVNASGGSVLYYSGNPQIQQEVSGGSVVLEY